MNRCKYLRRQFILLFWLVVLTSAVSRFAQATVYYEGFSYTAGVTVAGQAGGSGWTNAWATGGTGNFMGTNQAASLGYMDAFGYVLITNGGSLLVGRPDATTATSATPNRTLNNNLSDGSGTVAGPGATNWISFLYKRPKNAIGSLPFLRQATFSLFSGSGERMPVGSPNTTATVSNVLSVWTSGAHNVNAPFQDGNYPITDNATFFILLKVVADSGAGVDTAYCWFNWTNLNAEPDVTTANIVENEANLSDVNVIRLQANNQNASGSNAVFQVDEIRLGPTFADVTPNFNPSSTLPIITQNPLDVDVLVGSPATFTVTATGTALKYQWYYNTNTILANKTNNSFTIASTTTNDSGIYHVVVSNSSGAVTSSFANLNVQLPVLPTITSQPQDFNAIPGVTATFSVTATGTTPLRYQWYFNTNTALAGKTNFSYAFPVTSSAVAGYYTVVITNVVGAVTSAPAYLNFISVGPTNLPAFPGADGAAQYISGGRGGIVYHVTKLDRNYSHAEPGTLRYGLTDGNFPAGMPRTIVFDIGGTFWLGRYGAESNAIHGWDSQSRYNISAHTTVAGQTAPGPVIIAGGATYLGSSNSILRNVTCAPSFGLRSFQNDPDVPPTPGNFPDSFVFDALDAQGQNLMIDHVTTIYGTDETISANEIASNVTIQYCTIAQGENYPQADAENPGTYTGHALGSLLQAGSNAKISIVKNLYAHLKGRLPRVGTETAKLSNTSVGAVNDFRNNVFYNWFSTAGTGASSQPSSNNFIANFYLAGPGGDDVSGTNITTGNSGGTGIFDGASTSATKAFVSGNLKDTNKDGDPYDTSSADANFGSISSFASANDVRIGVTLDAASAFTNVLRYVGARWWERPYDFTLGNTNAISSNSIALYEDQRLIKEAFTGTGKIVAWADDPFNNSANEGLEWKAIVALRAATNTYAAPYNRAAGWDTDGDGIPDQWELEHGLDPNVANNNADFDNDGYTDLEEYLNDVAAWPAPGVINFSGATNNRYAMIQNWDVFGQSLSISGLGTVTTSSKWQPSRYDSAVISNATVVVDAVGQEAGTLKLRNSAVLNITNGWLKISNTVEVATAGAGTVNLTGGRLRVGTLTNGAGTATFNFTGGTLSADNVGFSLTNQGGVIAPGDGAGTTRVYGSLTLQAGSSLLMELGSTNAGQSDKITVDGNATLAGTVNVTNLAGFGAGSYPLLTYGGVSSGALTLGTTPAGYFYTLTNTAGQVKLIVTTSSATAPAISGPGNVVVLAGGNATFNVAVLAGSPAPALQWRTNGVDVAGATGTALTLAAAPVELNGLAVSVVATNSAGAVTNSAVLTVLGQLPRVTDYTLLTDGTHTLTLDGYTGLNYRLWAGTNVQQSRTNFWQVLTNGVFGAAPVVITDFGGTNYPKRYYQITIP